MMKWRDTAAYSMPRAKKIQEKAELINLRAKVLNYENNMEDMSGEWYVKKLDRLRTEIKELQETIIKLEKDNAVLEKEAELLQKPISSEFIIRQLVTILSKKK